MALFLVGVCTVLIGDANYEFESPNIHTKCWKFAMGNVHIVTKCCDCFSSILLGMREVTQSDSM